MNNMTWLHQVFPDFEIVLEYDNIDNKSLSREEIHGLLSTSTITNPENLYCLFCNKPYSLWTKKDIAHAISECLGNKRLINALECYDCNHLFGEIAENHLGKFIMPYRFIAEVYGKGKRNVIRDGKQGKDSPEPFRTFRFESKKNVPVFNSDIFDVKSLLIEVKDRGGRLDFTDYGFKLHIPRQTYDPRMVYASFLKMFYTLLPCVKRQESEQCVKEAKEAKVNIEKTEVTDQSSQSSQLSNNFYIQNVYDFADYIKGQISLYLALSKNPMFAPDGSIALEPFNEEDRDKYLSGLPNKGIEIRYASENVPNGVNVCLLRKKNVKSVFGNENLQNLQNSYAQNTHAQDSYVHNGHDEPRYLFAIQLKWYTIVIPACSDPIQWSESTNVLNTDEARYITAMGNTTAPQCTTVDASGNSVDISHISPMGSSSNSSSNIRSNILEPSTPYSFEIRCTLTNEITVRTLNFTKMESEITFDMQANRIDISEELIPQLEEDLRKAGLLEEKKLSKQLAGLVIRNFAKTIANVTTNTVFSFLHYGKDEISLTRLMTIMVISIAKISGMNWSESEASYFLKTFMVYYLRNRGITLLFKWIPFLGTVINTHAVMVLAETLGWATYLLVINRIYDSLSLSEEKKDQLWKEAENFIQDCE